MPSMMSQPDDADRWVGTVLFTGLGPSVEADRHRTTCPYHALQTIHLSTFLGPLFSNSSFWVLQYIKKCIPELFQSLDIPTLSWSASILTELRCPSSWKLYLDDFPYFLGSSLAHLEPKLQLEFTLENCQKSLIDDLSHHRLPNFKQL